MSILQNKQEKEFLKAVADFHNEYGVGYLFGDEWEDSPIQIHHVAGRAYKQSKVHIGHYFILPVPTAIHDVHSNHPFNVTHYRHKFTANYGMQRDLWCSMVDRMLSNGAISTAPSDEVISAIVSSKY